MILGDSVSSGYGVNPKENWVNLTLSDFPCKTKSLNLSVQGATSSDGITTLNDFYQKHQAKIIVIELGGNDALRGQSLTQLYKNLTQMITVAEAQKTKVVLVGVDMPPNYGNFFRQRLKTTYEHSGSSATVDNVFLDFPNNPQLIQEDGIHPNSLGHQQIFKAMKPVLQPLVCTSN